MSGSNITTQVWVAAGAPATFDKAGYEALTWVKVFHPITAPTPGIETSMIDIPNLETGFTKGVKGASMGRVSSMAHAFPEGSSTDAGQDDLKDYAAESYTDEISVKLVLPNSTNKVAYMTGLAFGYLENEGTTESYRGFTCSFRQNYPGVTTTPPV
jgi:hypothetical protein